jgi:hypothetical protein
MNLVFPEWQKSATRKIEYLEQDTVRVRTGPVEETAES